MGTPIKVNKIPSEHGIDLGFLHTVYPHTDEDDRDWNEFKSVLNEEIKKLLERDRMIHSTIAYNQGYERGRAVGYKRGYTVASQLYTGRINQ